MNFDMMEHILDGLGGFAPEHERNRWGIVPDMNHLGTTVFFIDSAGRCYIHYDEQYGLTEPQHVPYGPGVGDCLI